MHIHDCMGTHVCMPEGLKTISASVHLKKKIFFRHRLSLTQSLSSILGWLASKPQEYAILQGSMGPRDWTWVLPFSRQVLYSSPVKHIVDLIYHPWTAAPDKSERFSFSLGILFWSFLFFLSIMLGVSMWRLKQTKTKPISAAVLICFLVPFPRFLKIMFSLIRVTLGGCKWRLKNHFSFKRFNHHHF